MVEGRSEILVGEEWRAVDGGCFVCIPASVTHDFRNTSAAPSRLLNVFIPGGFERQMPAIADRFETHT